MAHQSEAMRAMAQRYLRLARTTQDARERSKYFDYAMLYAPLCAQTETRRAGARAASRIADETEATDVSRRHYRS